MRTVYCQNGEQVSRTVLTLRFQLVSRGRNRDVNSPTVGIYRCDIPTNAVHDDNDISSHFAVRSSPSDFFRVTCFALRSSHFAVLCFAVRTWPFAALRTVPGRAANRGTISAHAQ